MFSSCSSTSNQPRHDESSASVTSQGQRTASLAHDRRRGISKPRRSADEETPAVVQREETPARLVQSSSHREHRPVLARQASTLRAVADQQEAQCAWVYDEGREERTDRSAEEVERVWGTHETCQRKEVGYWRYEIARRCYRHVTCRCCESKLVPNNFELSCQNKNESYFLVIIKNPHNYQYNCQEWREKLYKQVIILQSKAYAIGRYLVGLKYLLPP